MTTLYCPCCEKWGLYGYTKWHAVEPLDPSKASEMNCQYKNMTWHYTYILDGAYGFRNAYATLARTGCRCEHSAVGDDGAWCQCGVSQRYRAQYILLKNAFYTEVKKGADPERWAPTFPRRVGEVMEKHKEEAAAALADKLPAVLIGVVMAYMC